MVVTQSATHLTAFILQKHTSSNQSKLVLLISDLLLFDISSWEEKPHHSFEELVHELDGERHHVHLMMQTVIIKKKYPTKLKCRFQGGCTRYSSPQSVPSRKFLPLGGALC